MDKRILVADNNQEFLETRVERLQAAGYTVYTAQSAIEAARILDSTWVHVAVIDIRLVDDTDDKDVSGLSLAKEEAYRAIPKIIVTGYPSYQFVREALGPALDGLPPAVDFITKNEGAEDMLRAVQTAFAQHVCINWNLTFRWRVTNPRSFLGLVDLFQRELGQTLFEQAAELEDLLRKLFFSYEQVVIEKLLWTKNGRLAIQVNGYSADRPAEEAFVITLGINTEMTEEDRRLSKYTPPGSASAGGPGGLRSETLHFAARACPVEAVIASALVTFSEYYKSNSAKEISTAVEHLFASTLAPWHGRGRVSEPNQSFMQLLRDWAGFTQGDEQATDLASKVSALCHEALALGVATVEWSPQHVSIHFRGGPVQSYANPISVLLSAEDVGGQLSRPSLAARQISPGGLDPDSILVDAQGNTQLTDFLQAGPTPIYCDFVALECAVRFALTPAADLKDWGFLESNLLASPKLSTSIPGGDVAPSLRKALGSILCLRRLAAQEFGEDPAPYEVTLAFFALADILAYHQTVRHTTQEVISMMHRLLLAAMTVTHLTQPAPTGLKAGLQVDEVRHEVRIEGYKVDLTPTEYDLVLYLYRRRSEACSRIDIVNAVLGTTNKLKLSDDDEHWLNTNIARLRQKLEVDPSNPRYIETVRKTGYRLN